MGGIEVIDALSAAAGSMADDVSRLSTISQNLANATTVGYKREIPPSSPFVRALSEAAGADAGTASTSIVDHRAGTLRFTGNALDLALEGDAFFEIETEHGAAYTRRGDFGVDAGGRLVTQSGDVVQGTGGALQLSTASPRIDREGRVFDADKLVGQLKIVQFADPRLLVRQSGGAFRSEQAPAVADGAKLRQGHLEASNVNTAAEMVKLIETMRHFEATQKVVQGVDEMMERSLRKLGEF
jgi:flagellar basal-body rod protein FlgF